VTLDRADAVVIGAGVNGLACALHLAARGWTVAVLERAGVPGGAVKSGEYTLPGFRHDWAAMNLSLFAGSKFHGRYGAALAARGLAFAPARDCFASVFPDATWLGVSTDAEATTGRIAAVSKADGAAWAALSAAFPGEAEHLFGLLNSPARVRA
jgi:phytoene dehydrogenase-like protein